MNESFDLIYQDLNIEDSSDMGEAALLDIIADRVAYLIEHDKDLLLSYLYRLDISEQKIDTALTPFEEDPPHIGIAKLILDRQKQRLASKLKYKVEPIDGWEF